MSTEYYLISEYSFLSIHFSLGRCYKGFGWAGLSHRIQVNGFFETSLSIRLSTIITSQIESSTQKKLILSDSRSRIDMRLRSAPRRLCLIPSWRLSPPAIQITTCGVTRSIFGTFMSCKLKKRIIHIAAVPHASVTHADLSIRILVVFQDVTLSGHFLSCLQTCSTIMRENWSLNYLAMYPGRLLDFVLIWNLRKLPQGLSLYLAAQTTAIASPAVLLSCLKHIQHIPSGIRTCFVLFEAWERHCCNSTKLGGTWRYGNTAPGSKLTDFASNCGSQWRVRYHAKHELASPGLCTNGHV